VEQETASWKKGVIADVTPLEGVAKVWCKKRLLGRKKCGSRNSCFQWEG
jgi:hypothetical protein